MFFDIIHVISINNTNISPKNQRKKNKYNQMFGLLKYKTDFLILIILIKVLERKQI